MLTGRELLDCLRSLSQEERREFARLVGVFTIEGMRSPPSLYGLRRHRQAFESMTPEQRAAIDRIRLL